MQHGKRARAFTLIELLVVLAIVATLALIAAPRVVQHDVTAKEAVLRDNLRQTRVVIEQFYGDLGRYPETLDELVERGYLRAVPRDPMAESTTVWRIVAPPAGHAGTVYDIKSGSIATALDGTPYASW
jgi:general secretion pathway protein G